MAIKKIQLRRDTATDWALNNPILAAGEIGIELAQRGGINRIKIGDGNTPWNDLEWSYYTKSEINETFVTKDELNDSITDLVNAAPETLDTIGELATALQENKEIVDLLEESVTKKANSEDLAKVATSGSYEDLINKLSDSTISAWGFIKGTEVDNKLADYLPLDGSAARLKEVIVSDLNDAPSNSIFTMTSGYNSADGNKPTTFWVSGITFRMCQNSSYQTQLCTSDSEKLYYRVEHNGSWTDWKTIAFTDSTVAAANKLVTSSGVDVLTHDNYSLFPIGGLVMNPNAEGISIGYSSISWHNSSNVWTKDIITFNSSGNVGIGTSPQYKLDVNGSFNATSGYINGNTLIHSGNIGSQSVASASTASSLASRASYADIDANTLTTTGSDVKYYNNIPNTSTNIPTSSSWQNSLLALGLHDNGVTAQMYFSKAHSLFYRANVDEIWRKVLDDTNLGDVVSDGLSFTSNLLSVDTDWLVNQKVRSLKIFTNQNPDDSLMGELFSTDYGKNLPSGADSYFTGITFATNGDKAYRVQFGVDMFGKAFTRAELGKVWNSWRQLAFTDSTVSNATNFSNHSINEFAQYTPGNGYVQFNLLGEDMQSLGKGDGYIEYYDNGGWYNSSWGKVTANSGFNGTSLSISGSASVGTLTIGGNSAIHSGNFQSNLIAQATTISEYAHGKGQRVISSGTDLDSLDFGWWSSRDNESYTNGPMQNFGLMVCRLNTVYKGQLAFPYSTNHFMWRCQAYDGSKSAWGSWKTIAFTSDIPTSLPASDVYAWAKAPTKPSYSWSEITGKPKISVVNNGTSNTTSSISPNTFYVWGSVSSLTITLATPSDSSIYNEYMFQFTCPSSSATTLSVPSSVKWTSTPILEKGKTYQVSIVNNLAVLGGGF